MLTGDVEKCPKIMFLDCLGIIGFLGFWDFEILIFCFLWGIVFFGQSSQPVLIPNQRRMSAHRLLDITHLTSSLILDLKYSTTDNFTKVQIYPTNARCLFLPEVGEAICQVIKKLSSQGLTLLIWDGYRPLSCQKKLWEVCPNPMYVSPPEMGGRHTRGTAVDCTLVSLESGELLEMGTPFDDFTEKAHRDYVKLEKNVLENRKLLEKLMEDEGFIGLETEWWHFDFAGWENCPPLDVGNGPLGKE